MKTDIQETIDHLRILDKNISPAPWKITHSRHLETKEGAGAVIEDAEGETVAEADVDFEHHAFFIDDALPLMVELRNALPVLLEELHNALPVLLEELRNALPVLLEEIDRLNTRLSISETRLGRVAASHPEAYLTALGGDKE